MSQPGLNVSQISIKVEGSPITTDAIGDLLEVTVDHHLHLPSMFTIRMLNHDMKWLDDETFREGKKIEITYGEQSAQKLLMGKVAVLEPDLNEAMPQMIVRGYDLSHTLYRGRKRRSFTNVTDSDLVQKLATEASLTAMIEATTEVHEYVFQNNQTNAEFLLERASRIGYELWVEDDKLNFRKPQASGEPVSIAWGTNLRSFRPRLSTAEQVNEVEVRGWDPKQKKEVVGRASKGNGSPQIGITQPGADVAKSAWGEAKYAVVDKFVRSPAEADKVAQATLDKLASSFVEAEGACDGNPKIKGGVQVKIEGVGNRFNGTYYVTQAVHHWTKDAGLKTHFNISGQRNSDLIAILQAGRPAHNDSSMRGFFIGIVTNNKDPDEMGRVRVKFPALSMDDESAWARVVAPMAGDGRGFFYLPEVDDEVLCGFESGDIHRPFVLGALWNGKDKTPIATSDAVGGDGKVNKRVIKSRSGHIITLDDTSGSEEITIVDKTGNNKIVMHAPDNSMQIKVDGDFTLEAKGKIVLKSIQGVDMQSQADFKVSGQTGVDISTTAQLKLSGTAAMDINSTGPMTVAGMPIKLN